MKKITITLEYNPETDMRRLKQLFGGLLMQGATGVYGVKLMGQLVNGIKKGMMENGHVTEVMEIEEFSQQNKELIQELQCNVEDWVESKREDILKPPPNNN